MSSASARRFIAAAAALLVLPPSAWAESTPYRLGPSDKLLVKVFDWRPSTGEVHDWSALGGEYTVGPSGTISVPLIGEVPASGLSTADLGSSIADRLKSKVGLSQRPDASVQIVRFRPYFILGKVDKPGTYEYQSDLTILKAVSAAGGFRHASDATALASERDTLVTLGDLRVMTEERVALRIRQARLDAEVSGAEAITLPADLQARMNEPAIDVAVRQEQRLMDAHGQAVSSQVQALRDEEGLLREELTSLAAKDSALSHQLDLARTELSQVSSLVSKGLAVAPRQLEAEQSSAQYESNRLDVQVSTLRAQQALARAERDILDIQNRRRDAALTETIDVRDKLAASVAKVRTAEALLAQSENAAPSPGDDIAPHPVYRLTRQVNGRSETTDVEESDVVQPGDVVQVGFKRAAVESADPDAKAKHEKDGVGG